MAQREWPGFVGMASGLVGAFIAAGVFYFTVIRQVDDVRVVIGDPPVVYISESGKTLESNGEQELTFMNAGNRHAAISNIKGMVIPIEKGESSLPKCQIEDTLSISFKPESFVMKPGEVIVSKLLLQEGFWKRKKKEGGYIADNTFFSFENASSFLVCLVVSVTTPDAFDRDMLKPAFKYTLFNVRKTTGETKIFEPLFEQNRPITLLKKASTIFDSW
jgi:hypothetical protein